MALKGIKVLELGGLAPAPFCGMILADFGASVIRVDKIDGIINTDVLGSGKRSIAINLKHEEGRKAFYNVAKQSDVLIEPFRKGVMESLKIGPSVLLQDNPRLIYARLTGYGQDGFYSKRAGHDINYIALSGLLSVFGRANENPIFPANTIADFAAGGLMCAMGILLALHERNSSGLGQVIDSSMVDGSAYLGSWLYRSQCLPIWGKPRGQNFIDSGAPFYEVYKTKDDKYMSVGALEPQFYTQLLKGLGLSEKDAPHSTNFEKNKEIFKTKFLEKTQKEWCEIFDFCDACVAPVLTLDDAPQHPHNVTNETFVKSYEDKFVPNPAPKLSRTPGSSHSVDRPPLKGEHTSVILEEVGYSQDEIKRLDSFGAVYVSKPCTAI